VAETQLHLLKSRRFAPLFITQFLGAVNDNLLKTALVTLVTYRTFADPTTTKIVVAIATAVFIAPYFIASATAGQLADKLEKSGLVRAVKLWEVGVMVLAAAGFGLGGEAFIYFELAVLLLLGVQATFFGPVKYGILPELLAREDLMGGNALVEAGTFLAILLGTIAGGLLILVPRGEAIVSAALLAFALAGWAASLRIPRGRGAAPTLRINPNIWAETMAIIRFARAHRELWLSILAISWFWLVGAVFLSQFPTYAKDTLGADANVETLFLATFSVGIGAGSVLCGRLLQGEVSARLTPLGAVGMALFSLDLYGASARIGGGEGALIGVGGFLGHLADWRLLADLFMIALCGGLFTVPLYALLQARSEESHRSRVVAANNVLNALFIVASGAISAAMLKLGLSVPQIFLAVGIANTGAALVVLRLDPRRRLRDFFRFRRGPR
jgi:acyl-[acyl-carrier-protein]-phospholipid O-acyltransferase / long-chain-fatty-acid--[acyl-carrier-protein] ligase